MKNLLSEGSAADIQKYLFPSAKSTNFDIKRLTEAQINRHIRVLAHRHRQTLKSIL